MENRNQEAAERREMDQKEMNREDMILILKYSDEFAVEAARRLRDEHIYSRIISGMTTAAQIREIRPRGIILCGEAASAQGVLDAQILDLGIPLLALGHASHMLLAALGGACAGVAISEKKAFISYGKSPLFAGLMDGERYLKETLTLMLPVDVQGTASAGGCTLAFECSAKKLYGVQFELERNDPEGTAILKNFARDLCGCTGWFTMKAALEQAQRALQEAAEQGGRALCAVSGGLDSAVTALLAHRVFGGRMTAIYVETGLMREGEGAAVQRELEALGIPLRSVDRSGVVLEALAHRRSMREKREVVFKCLHEEMISQAASISETKVLILGTNYNDVLRGRETDGWKDCGMALLEPLAFLFKEEIRELAKEMGLAEELVQRKPFPMLGLGGRILGEVTGERLHALRTAEAIFDEEIRQAGLARKLHKYFPVLADADPVLDSTTIILRAVTISGGMLVPARLPYDLVERTVQRILAATPSVLRVFYDQTPTPVGKETFA